MLLGSEDWVPNVLRMVFVMMTIVTSSTACPSFCTCTAKQLAAECFGTTSQFVTAARQLPDNLQEFTFTAKPSVPQPAHREFIDLNLPQMLRFKNLTSFKIRPLSQSRYFDFGLDDIPKDWVFCQMQKLKALHLNILLYRFDNSSVACLGGLATLDLSFTKKLTGAVIKSVILSLTSKKLTSLLLRNVQEYENQGLTRFVFLELLPPSAPFAGELTELDFSYNSISALGPGASLLLSLKRVDFSGNLLLSNYAWDLLSRLTYMELFFLHPSIEELRGSFQGFFNPRQLKRSLVAVTDAMYTGDREMNLECLEGQLHSLITNTTDLSEIHLCLAGNCNSNMSTLCRQPPHQVSRTADSECSYFKNIPLGRQLRTVHIGSVSSTTGASPSIRESTLCFNPNNQLEVLDMSNNRLDDYLATPDVLERFKITGLLNLSEFNLEENGIQLSNPSFLNEFPSLEVLLFAGNQIVLNKSNETFFEATPKLRILDLSRNGLSDIPDEEFASLHFLETLNLSGNQLSKLNFQLSNSTSLEVLNISENLISSVPTSFSKMLLSSSPNVSVDLRGNPLICGCETMDFMNTVQSGILKLYKKEDLICYHPKLGRVSIIHVDLGALKKACSPFLQIIQYVGITLAVVLVAALLLLLWRIRWKIRYFLYRLRRSVNNYQNLIPGDDNFEWDGFVAYSSEDRNWVHYRLQEEIEDNRNHRLFMYLRTVLPDERLIERLDDTIGNCRKVIVVLSRAFLESDHCLYDASLAHTRLQHEGRDVVILVKLGRLPITGVPQMITRLLTTATCLEWTEDRDGQRLFWDRLEEELMTPPRNPLRE